MLHSSRQRSAAYGAACTNCSQAKCRCVRQASGSKCERCERLDKDCHPVGGRRRKIRAARAAPREAQLEEKIDGLVSLLTSRHRRAAETVAVLGDVDVSARNAMLSPRINLNDARNNTSGLTLKTLPQHHTAAPIAELNAEILADDEQEYCLHSFRTLKLKQFPFIYIPSTTLARDLRTEKPFTWLCIMAVSTRSTSQQTLLRNLVKRELAERMLYSLEKSLDLLLGILICIFWGNFQVQRRPFLSLYTQLATSLVFDLGLNKPAPKEADAMAEYRFHLSQVRPIRSMEDRRVVLACFVASSVVSLKLHRIDPFRWTAHMDECLEELKNAPECSGDGLLSLLVRSQLILDKASQSPWHSGRSVDGEASATVPPEFYVKALLAQVHEVRQSIPPELQENEVLHLNLHHAELRIHEVALSPCASILSDSRSFARLESLHATLVAARSWFDVFFNIPPAEYVGFTFATFSQLGSTAGALYRLSTLEDCAWDRAHVQRTADVLALADRAVRNFEQAAALAGWECDGGEEDVLTRVAGKMKAIMQKWASRLSVDFIKLPMSTGQGVEVSNLSTDLPFHLPEDAWLTDVLEPWAW